MTTQMSYNYISGGRERHTSPAPSTSRPRAETDMSRTCSLSEFELDGEYSRWREALIEQVEQVSL